MDLITLDMEIEDIVDEFPQTIGPMQEMGVQCMLCGEPVWGTLGERIKEKELPDADEILLLLNTVAAEVVEEKNRGKIEVDRYQVD